MPAQFLTHDTSCGERDGGEREREREREREKREGERERH